MTLLNTEKKNKKKKKVLQDRPPVLFFELLSKKIIYIANSMPAVSVDAHLTVGDHPINIMALRIRHHPQIRRVVQSIWCQFHQRFTSSFCASRSQKHEKILTT
jgi:hypothetical protein